MVDDHIADGHKAPCKSWRTILARKHRGQDQPRRTIDAAGPGPAAGNFETAVGGFNLGSWNVGNGEEIVRVVPDLLLSFERIKGGHPAKANGECSAPPGTAAGAAQFEADLREFGRAILISAEALGLHQAKYSCVAKRIHCLGRHPLCLL